MRKTFLSYFCTIKDHRINRRKRHPLENIIIITIISIICGAETWAEVCYYGNVRKKFFSKFLDLKNGIPSKDTFRRFFAALDPQVFEEHFLRWTRSLVKDMDKEFVSIDGKTIRGASRMRADHPVHLVSAWASRNELILGQLKVAEKSNEITAIPALLDVLFLKGSTVSIDAMGCQKEIAKKIVEHEADYVLSLKENHPSLLEDVIRGFDKKPCHEIKQTLDFGHGRIEERKYGIIKNLYFLLDRESWVGLQAVVRVDSRRTIKKTGEVQQETRYYLTSLTEVKKISKAIRSHWGIENKTHWCLDTAFGEDSSGKRAGFSAQNFSLINKIALNAIRNHDDSKRFKVKIGIKSKRKFAALIDEYLFELLHSL